jgi:hypothetical protein
VSAAHAQLPGEPVHLAEEGDQAFFGLLAEVQELVGVVKGLGIRE